MKNYVFIIIGLSLIALSLTMPGANKVVSLVGIGLGVLSGIILRISRK